MGNDQLEKVQNEYEHKSRNLQRQEVVAQQLIEMADVHKNAALLLIQKQLLTDSIGDYDDSFEKYENVLKQELNDCIYSLRHAWVAEIDKLNDEKRDLLSSAFTTIKQLDEKKEFLQSQQNS